jgi:hypothetical protein
MKDFAGKIRRHTYSVALLREQAELRAHAEDLGWARRGQDGESVFGEDDGADWDCFDFDAWSLKQSGQLDWSLERLPEGIRRVGFAELALALASDPRGYALLEGVERGSAGLEEFRRSGLADRIGTAFSFCLDGTTYTAFENPDDGYRSSMAFMVAQEGNWCAVPFAPVALVPQFRRTTFDDWDEEDSNAAAPGQWRRVPPGDVRAGHADLLDLLVPGSSEQALSVGTSRSDSYYPSFVGWLDPAGLEKARSMAVSLAYELDEDVVHPEPRGPGVAGGVRHAVGSWRAFCPVPFGPVAKNARVRSG